MFIVVQLNFYFNLLFIIFPEFTCTSVDIMKPKVSDICIMADESTASSHIILPQPINSRMAVPKNSANSILHIFLLSDTSSIAIIPCTTRKKVKHEHYFVK